MPFLVGKRTGGREVFNEHKLSAFLRKMTFGFDDVDKSLDDVDAAVHEFVVSTRAVERLDADEVLAKMYLILQKYNEQLAARCLVVSLHKRFPKQGFNDYEIDAVLLHAADFDLDDPTINSLATLAKEVKAPSMRPQHVIMAAFLRSTKSKQEAIEKYKDCVSNEKIPQRASVEELKTLFQIA